MAGEWIKLELATINKPEVMRIARIINAEQDFVLGKLIRLWIWFDKNTVDGDVDGLVDADVDSVVSHSGFCSALRSVGWIEDLPGGRGMRVPNFGRHNGESAKKRTLKNERQARWRQGSTDKPSTPASTRTSTPASTREEKRREDKPQTPPSGFERFWTVYPKKLSKGQAEKAWQKLSPDEQLLERIVSAVERAKTRADWRKDSGQFIPHPATWLNAKGWEDSAVIELPEQIRRVAV